MTSWKERILSALIPVLAITGLSTSVFFLFIVPIAGYFLAKKYQYRFSADSALNFFDFITSIFIMLFLFGLLSSALAIMANDGGFTIPLISSGLLKDFIRYIGIFYLLIGCLLHIVFALLGRKLSMPLSFKLFETLRGKNLKTTVKTMQK